MQDNLVERKKSQELFENIEQIEKRKKIDPSEILDICDRIIEMDSEHAQAYAKRSKYLYGRCDYSLALRDINRAIDLGFKTAETYYLRATCYAIIGNKEAEFMSDIKSVIKLDPRHPQANRIMGNYYYDRGYEPDAYKHFSEAIDNKVSDAIVFFRRGTINMNNGRYEHAIVDFMDSQKCNPSYALTYYLRANCYYEIGALDRALKDYESASFVDVHSPDPYYKMGCVYYDKGDFDNSVKNFTMLINLLPDSETGYYSRGISWLAKNDFEAATADFEQALSINANDAATCYLLSQSYLGQGNEELGKKCYEQALSLGYEPKED